MKEGEKAAAENEWNPFISIDPHKHQESNRGSRKRCGEGKGENKKEGLKASAAHKPPAKTSGSRCKSIGMSKEGPLTGRQGDVGKVTRNGADVKFLQRRAGSDIVGAESRGL